MMAKEEGLSMSCWMERAILRAFTAFAVRNKKYAMLAASMPESLNEAASLEGNDDENLLDEEEPLTEHTDESSAPQKEEDQDA